MTFRPDPDLIEQIGQIAAQIGQLVLDPRRNDRKNLAPHQPVTLQNTKRLRQHLGRDAFDLALQLAITPPARLQSADDQIHPLARQHLEHGVRHAFAPEGVIAERRVGSAFTIHGVPIYH